MDHRNTGGRELPVHSFVGVLLAWLCRVVWLFVGQPPQLSGLCPELGPMAGRNGLFVFGSCLVFLFSVALWGSRLVRAGVFQAHLKMAEGTVGLSGVISPEATGG